MKKIIRALLKEIKSLTDQGNHEEAENLRTLAIEMGLGF
jgi:hypothetical protein